MNVGMEEVAAVSPETTVVVANSNMSGSVELAEYYLQARGIPQANLIVVNASNNETIGREAYNATEVDIRAGIIGAGLEETVDVIVPVYGMPLRVNHNETDPGGSRNGTQASFDAELSLMFSQVEAFRPGREDFPPYYWLNETYNREANYNVVLVMRLDGPTVDDARRLVDHALEAEAQNRAGWAYFDAKPDWAGGDEYLKTYDDRIQAAFELAQERGMAAALEETDRNIGHGQAQWNVSSHTSAEAANGTVSPWFYWGWINSDYSDHYNWQVGAVGQHVHSVNAKTLRNESWWLSGAIADNITATAGHVWEPYVDSASHPKLVLEHLLDGYTIVESFYRGSQYMGWANVFVGDPLYTPVKVNFSVELVEAAETVVRPGARLNLSVNLTNNGPYGQDFKARIVPENNNLFLTLATAEISMPGQGQSHIFNIGGWMNSDLVSYPAGDYPCQLWVWQEGNPFLPEIISFNITLTPKAKFELTSPRSLDMFKGIATSITIALQNKGNQVDDFQLELKVPEPIEVLSFEVVSQIYSTPPGNDTRILTGDIGSGAIYGLMVHLRLPEEAQLELPTTMELVVNGNSTLESDLNHTLSVRLDLFLKPEVVDDDDGSETLRITGWIGLGLVLSLVVVWVQRRRGGY